MLDPASTWKSEIEGMPKVADDSWHDNFANLVDGLTSSKLFVGNIIGVTTFTFGKGAFKTALAACAIVSDPIVAGQNFANAWAAGIAASTMSVPTGAAVGAPTPATIFGPLNTAGAPAGPPTTLIDAPSIAAAKTALGTAISIAPPADNALAFATAFRAAFLSLTFTTTGFNSLPFAPPGSVPAPLVNAAAPGA